MIQQTNAARFLVAKYVSDLRRMEPRNVGVIVWSNGVATSRFLGDEEDIPKHVQSKNAYRQWIEYWRLQLGKGSLRRRDGTSVDRDNPEYVDVLCSQSKPQYMLVDGGVMLEQVDANSINEVTADLFQELVCQPKATDRRETTKKPDGRELFNASQKVMRESGLAARDDFHANYAMVCRVKDEPLPFHFDYALHDKKPDALFHRVPLREENVLHSTAFRFPAMQKTFDIESKQCVALVHVDDDDHDDETDTARRFMESFCTVINVANPVRAAGELLAIAS